MDTPGASMSTSMRGELCKLTALINERPRPQEQTLLELNVTTTESNDLTTATEVSWQAVRVPGASRMLHYPALSLLSGGLS